MVKGPRLARLGSQIAMLELRTAPPARKVADPHYASPEHRAWRKAVLDRARWRCEDLDADGSRCAARAPGQALYADHKVELKDGGAPLDPYNGVCRCARHHTLKTNAMREARHAAPLPSPSRGRGD